MNFGCDNLLRRVRLSFVIVAGSLAFSSDRASAADPFYEALKADGIAAYDRGDFNAAGENLRLACFGLLEKPVALAECLSYLAVAQAKAADVPAFSETFDRILDVERVAQAFSRLALDSTLRQSLEGYLLQWIPYAKLARSPVFRETARRKQEAAVREMVPEERRLELQKLVASEPNHIPWRLALAELNLVEGDAASALEVVSAVLAAVPRNSAAVCLRGHASAALGNCEVALVDFEACPESPEVAQPGTRQLAESQLRCQVDGGAWTEASLLLSQLPPGDLRRSPFRQLEKQVRRGLREEAAAQRLSVPVDDTATEPTPASHDVESPAESLSVGTPVEAGDPTETLSGSQPAIEPVASARGADPRLGHELERLRSIVGSGSHSDLERVLVEARKLAEEYSQEPEPLILVAETAYRLRRWQDTVIYFRRAGQLTPARPEHQFYLAVALYESGERGAAREMLERCVGYLEQTPFVKEYVVKINGG